MSVVVNSQNPKKAPGEDGITANIIIRIHVINESFLTRLYNKCLDLSYFPKLWRKSVIKIIPKPNKSDYRDPNAYRPISLLPIHAKILEKLLINRINYYLHQNSKLNERQFGFTPQKLTEDALKSLIDFVKSTFERKGFAIVLSLDINGAFNTCWWPKIINPLRVKGCPNNLLSLVKSYFCERESKLWFMCTETVRAITVGCPQGSASGPGFWNISIDDVFELSEGPDCEVECFADDTIIKIFAKTSEELELRVNNKLQELNEWSIANKLTFNISKTNCALFTRNLKFKKPEIVFDGQKLSITTTFKHLGVMIDSKLTWRAHCNYVKSKVMRFTNNLLRFAKTNYGLDSRAIEAIYKGAILPTIGYAVPVWVEATDRKFAIKPLEQIQRLIALRMIKSYRTVSYNAVNVIANFVPIDLWLKSRAIEYYIKKNVRHALVDQYMDGYGIDCEQIQRPTDFRQLLHPSERHALPITDQTIADNEIFIDSRITSQGTGAAFAICRDQIIIFNKKLKLSSICSWFQALMWALLKAIKTIDSIKWCSKTIIIHTRAHALIAGLQDAHSTTYLICEIFKEINALKQNDILFKIHLDSTREQMETTARLAREAADLHQRFDYDSIPISYVRK